MFPSEGCNVQDPKWTKRKWILVHESFLTMKTKVYIKLTVTEHLPCASYYPRILRSMIKETDLPIWGGKKHGSIWQWTCIYDTYRYLPVHMIQKIIYLSLNGTLTLSNELETHRDVTTAHTTASTCKPQTVLNTCLPHRGPQAGASLITLHMGKAEASWGKDMSSLVFNNRNSWSNWGL